MTKYWNKKLEINSFDNSKALARLNTIWKPLDIGWHKLNFDGVMKGNPRLDSIGDIIKEPKGNLVDGYVGGIRTQSSMTTEAIVLLKGVKIIVNLGINTCTLKETPRL